MFKRALLAATVLTLVGSAHAAADKPGLSVTIYNANLALVQDVRRLQIAVGRQRLEFKDVSSAIRPETVTLNADRVSIVEQNFDYDLITPQKMMEKAVGGQVQIVRVNPGTGAQVTETATVLSANEGVVLKIGERIEVLRDDGLPTRVIFNGLPENLRAHPTLSVTVDSERAGERLATLSYLTTGLAWKADYVALFDEPDAKLDLQGWITLTNTSGTGFKDADTQLVAGDVAAGGNGEVGYSPRNSYRPNMAQPGLRQGGSEARTGPGEALGDAYIYTLPERTTIAQNQTKQVSFLDAKAVTAHKVYQWSNAWFQGTDDPSSAQVVIDFANSSAGGLGAGLPAGTIRVYQRDSKGEPKFVGENQIGHIPQGSELAVKIGDAFDVTVEPTAVSSTAINNRRSRYVMSYEVHNAKSQAVTVELRQGGLWRDYKMIKENISHRSVDAYTLGWSVPVAANGSTTLTTEFETWW